MTVARIISGIVNPAMSIEPIMITGTLMDDPAQTRLVFHQPCRS